jgi:hypothetical protein
MYDPLDQELRAVVYDEDGHLLATGPGVTIVEGQPPGWVNFPLGLIELPDVCYIGLHAGPGEVAQVFADADVSVGALNRFQMADDPYAYGPALTIGGYALPELLDTGDRGDENPLSDGGHWSQARIIDPDNDEGVYPMKLQGGNFVGALGGDSDRYVISSAMRDDVPSGSVFVATRVMVMTQDSDGAGVVMRLINPMTVDAQQYALNAGYDEASLFALRRRADATPWVPLESWLVIGGTYRQPTAATSVRVRLEEPSQGRSAATEPGWSAFVTDGEITWRRFPDRGLWQPSHFYGGDDAIVAGGYLWVVNQQGTSGSSQPNWAAVPPGFVEDADGSQPDPWPGQVRDGAALWLRWGPDAGTWAPNHLYTSQAGPRGVGRPVVRATVPDTYRYAVYVFNPPKATTTTGATEPTWNTINRGLTLDGGIMWRNVPSENLDRNRLASYEFDYHDSWQVDSGSWIGMRQEGLVVGVYGAKSGIPWERLGQFQTGVGLNFTLSTTGGEVPDITGYRIYRSTSGSVYTLIATIETAGYTGSGTYLDTTVVPGQVYFYKVQAFVEGGFEETALPIRVHA